MPPFTTSPAVTALLAPLLGSNHALRILGRRQQQQLALNLSRHAVFSRQSSMSAIVRGLRRSFRDPDGKRPPGYNPEVAAHVRQRRQEREAAEVPKYKLFRGKKDVTKPPIPKAKTRRARFFDPDDEYGKKSLVYQAKTGKLEAEVKSLARQRARDRGEEEYEERDRRSFRRDDGGRRRRDSRDNDFDNDLESRSRSGRTSGVSFGGRDGPRSRQGVTGRRDRDRRGDLDERRSYDRDHAPERRDRGSERRFDTRSDTRSERRFGREQREDYDEERSHNRDDRRDNGYDIGRNSRSRDSTASTPVPLSIPYTTAASQFLYGRSVVEAALRAGRRQLYKLYVYGGAHRGFNARGTPQDQGVGRAIERLAKGRGVSVQIVDERWQRLLDKMSKGRPHNGYVLEASPLPQPPVTALGKYTDGTAAATTDDVASSPLTKGAGFSAEVGYQSREEANVNGTAVFVAVDAGTARYHRPLVLLLDQVLDPGNLGAILRSASFLGVSAVAVSKHSSATLTSVALKASAGAAEALSLFSVETPATFLAESRKAGWKVYAAVPPPDGYVTRGLHAKTPVLDLDGLEAADPLQTEPIILVMGSEGEGLPRAIRREADVEVSIANRSGTKVVDSLNVSVATGLLCASLLKGSTQAVANARTDHEAAFEAALKDGATPAEAADEEKQEVVKPRDELGIF
ncbi:RNA methyltransferase [Sporothrix brasiliensis 5110]|uniref:rRNA methyltransferase 1, mitochondrial n=1 Tax=Sporothrix brasiliensis 5110 TaxID=1398154 RepID=A0A0C2IYN4_9PEZI|nr:RNA methyltransferase [Sporothrix brasiliensis 5110]KIH94171.1 RNA methyltransferase [Sporothrix brasiliensis 5110]